MNQGMISPARTRRAAAPLLAIGGMCGLAWAAGLRGLMAELAGSGSDVGWYGTFAQILLPGVIVGILLGWAEHVRRTGGRRGWRWLAAAPVVFTGSAIAIPLLGVAGGYAMSGRGPRWARILLGVVAIVPVPGWAFASSLFGSAFALSTPRGAWTALFFYSFIGTLDLACTIPHRPVVQAGPAMPERCGPAKLSSIPDGFARVRGGELPRRSGSAPR